MLSLHRDTPLDQQAAPSGEPPEAPAGGGQRVSNAFDDGFAGFTLKGALHCASCHRATICCLLSLQNDDANVTCVLHRW